MARDFSLYDQEQMQDPHRIYSELRSTCPVAHSEQDDSFWIATRYDDVVATTLDTDTFSSRYIMVPRLKFGPDFVDRPPITSDPPRHTEFRRVLQPKFTTPQVQKWEPAIRAICRDLLASFIGRGACDASADYAKKIPLGFTCALMGVPPADEPRFDQWCKDLVTLADADGILRAAGEMAVYLAGLVQDRTANPTDDFVNVLMHSEIEGKPLEGQELIAVLMLILIAGLDTTWNALSSALWHLASHPEDRDRLVAEPALIPTAVEELLRFYAPVALTREANHDTEIGGVKIAKGELVLLSWPSANRDPDAFPDADRVVIDRQINRHLAFGVGPHRCLGSAIARLEMRIAIEEWLRAIPEFELTDSDAVTWSTGHIWGPHAVEVHFPPAAGS
jgi:hypothetical protein